MPTRIAIFVMTILLASITWGQAQTPSGSQQSMSGMDMPGHDMSKRKDAPAGVKEKEADSEAGAPVMRSMEGHMDMGPHMKVTGLRPAKPGDSERAQQVVTSARVAAEKYRDFHTALNDGYKIFLPNFPQKIYHFTNYTYGMEAAFHFNPEHPTSLLYEKHGEDDYKLIGVMYTAPKRLGEDELDQRIPLSVAHWHEHVNFCAAPEGRKKQYLDPHTQFGLKGSITTQEACDEAGGVFHPVIFNWMVHVYPFEKDPANIWSVERQHGDTD